MGRPHLHADEGARCAAPRLGGLAAVDRFERLKPELVILDLMLPGKDGLAICRELADRGFFVIRYDNRDVGRSTRLDAFPPPSVTPSSGPRPPCASTPSAPPSGATDAATRPLPPVTLTMIEPL